MYVCVKCRREMLCKKNAVGALYGTAHVYPGDKFSCPECGCEVLATNNAAIYDHDLHMLDEYIAMQNDVWDTAGKEAKHEQAQG